MDTSDDRGVPLSDEGDLVDADRRRLLKALAAGGGALAAAAFVPSRWSKGVVEMGATSAHAQVSPTPVLGTGDFQVTLTWNTGNPGASDCIGGGRMDGAVDIDLHIVEPDGTVVYFANKTGTTAELDWDNQVAFGPENIFVPAGRLADGTYQVYVVYYCGMTVPTVATIRIRVFVGRPGEREVTFTRTLTVEDRHLGVNVAEVSFPAGTIAETSGTRVAMSPVDDLDGLAGKGRS